MGEELLPKDNTMRKAVKLVKIFKSSSLEIKVARILGIESISRIEYFQVILSREVDLVIFISRI
jgi:hypothetical protein